MITDLRGLELAPCSQKCNPVTSPQKRQPRRLRLCSEWRQMGRDETKNVSDAKWFFCLCYTEHCSKTELRIDAAPVQSNLAQSPVWVLSPALPQISSMPPIVFSKPGFQPLSLNSNSTSFVSDAGRIHLV